jgi:hypothetical protein
LQIGYFKNHVRNFQLIATPIVIGGSYLLTAMQFTPSDTNKFVWIVGLFTAVTATYYLIYDITDASYQILVLAERLASIERSLNLIAGEKLFVWESEISQSLNSGIQPFSADRWIFHPTWCMRGYAGLLLVALAILLPLWGAIEIWQATSTHIEITRALINALSIYAVGSAIFAYLVIRGVENRLRAQTRNRIAKKLRTKRSVR